MILFFLLRIVKAHRVHRFSRISIFTQSILETWLEVTTGGEGTGSCGRRGELCNEGMLRKVACTFVMYEMFNSYME